MVTVRLEAEVLQTIGVSESLESRLLSSLEYLSCPPLSLVAVLASPDVENRFWPEVVTGGEVREGTEGVSSRTLGLFKDNVEEMLVCAAASEALSALGNVLF